ncbi:MAG: hypothetical protein PSX37_08100, partial [bacterium]|nr:hypothetical protein [bacterium]
QGTLAEVAIAAGAVAYETGIGWRERCDLSRAMTQLRHPRTPGGMARPVYIEGLRRSIPKKTVEALATRASLAALLTCQDPSCCPDGRLALLNDGRAHALRSRLRTLEAVASPAQAAWKWHQVAESAADAVTIAERLNNAAIRIGGLSGIDDAGLKGTLVVALTQRNWARRRAA